MRKIVALLFVGFILMQVNNTPKVIEVKAEEEIRDYEMPPYLRTNLLVNISVSAFDSNLIGSDGNLLASSVRANGDNIRMEISSMLRIEDFNRGWTFFEVSLSAYDREAQIRPAMVERLETSASDISERIIFGYKISSLYEHSIDNFVLYPSSLNENNTRDSTAIIGWEASEDEMGKSHLNILKARSIQRSTAEFPLKTLYQLPYQQTRTIKGLRLGVPDAIPQENDKLDYKYYTVSKDLSNSIFQWTLESFGFDINKQEEREYVKGFYAETMDIERYFPYEYASVEGNFFHETILKIVDNGINDIIVQPTQQVIKQTVGIDVAKAAADITAPVNLALDVAKSCVISFPPCTSVPSGIANDLIPNLLSPITDFFFPSTGAPTPEPPPPPQYPPTSDIPVDTNTNVDAAPVDYLSSIVGGGIDSRTIGIVAIIIVSIILVIVLVSRRGGPSPEKK